MEYKTAGRPAVFIAANTGKGRMTGRAYVSEALDSIRKIQAARPIATDYLAAKERIRNYNGPAALIIMDDEGLDAARHYANSSTDVRERTIVIAEDLGSLDDRLRGCGMQTRPIAVKRGDKDGLAGFLQILLGQYNSRG